MDFSFNLNIDSIENENKTVPLDINTLYDVLIIGGGPSAMTAAVYTLRKGLKTGIIAKQIGGQLSETSSVENYMGYNYIEGHDLASKFEQQIKQFELGYKVGALLENISLDKNNKILKLNNGEVYKSKSVIIASGSSWRKLNIPGESEFTGKGVSYCTTCDAPFFQDKTVAVVGGGNSGIEAAIDLVKVAKKVIILEFTDTIKADQVLLDSLKTYNNYEILLSHELKEIIGEHKVKSGIISDRITKEKKEIELDGVFVEIGLSPNSSFAKDVLVLNKHGEIKVDCKCNTSVGGIFAAGDVSTVPFKQIIIAAGEGAKAALSAADYILKEY